MKVARGGACQERWRVFIRTCVHMNTFTSPLMLTEKQEAILDFIRSVQAEQGIPPSTRQIQRQFGYSSQNAAMNHLRASSSERWRHVGIKSQ